MRYDAFWMPQRTSVQPVRRVLRFMRLEKRIALSADFGESFELEFGDDDEFEYEDLYELESEDHEYDEFENDDDEYEFDDDHDEDDRFEFSLQPSLQSNGSSNSLLDDVEPNEASEQNALGQGAAFQVDVDDLDGLSGQLANQSLESDGTNDVTESGQSAAEESSDESALALTKTESTSVSRDVDQRTGHTDADLFAARAATFNAGIDGASTDLIQFVAQSYSHGEASKSIPIELSGANVSTAALAFAFGGIQMRADAIPQSSNGQTDQPQDVRASVTAWLGSFQDDLSAIDEALSQFLAETETAAVASIDVFTQPGALLTSGVATAAVVSRIIYRRSRAKDSELENDFYAVGFDVRLYPEVFG